MITKNIKVPTGNICTMKGEHGELEFLSIGDYGKDKNIKADFLGMKNEINGVPNGDIMPLSEKWVITLSTQYGCSMGCTFCDVPLVGKGRNATAYDLYNEVINALELHPEITATKRLNVHYARMGEPTFNKNVLISACDLHYTIKPYIGNSIVHPVLSTMMPVKNKILLQYLNDWCDIKNDIYKGDAGLQLSINSTDDSQRNDMFGNTSLDLYHISQIADALPMPLGRKYCLNFAITDTTRINGYVLSRLFDTKKFMAKITPIHKNKQCDKNGIKTSDGYNSFYPYKKHEEDLKDAGFDVIVFVPSLDEDLGMITCGNAILSGRMPEIKYEVIK